MLVIAGSGVLAPSGARGATPTLEECKRHAFYDHKKPTDPSVKACEALVCKTAERLKTRGAHCLPQSNDVVYDGRGAVDCPGPEAAGRAGPDAFQATVPGVPSSATTAWPAAAHACIPPATLAAS